MNFVDFWEIVSFLVSIVDLALRCMGFLTRSVPIHDYFRIFIAVII